MIAENNLDYSSGSTPAVRKERFQPHVYVAAFTMSLTRNITDTFLKDYTFTPSKYFTILASPLRFSTWTKHAIKGFISIVFKHINK